MVERKTHKKVHEMNSNLTQSFEDLRTDILRMNEKIDSLSDRLVLVSRKIGATVPKSKTKTFYSSGAKGSRYHTNECPSFKRIKKPKSYKTREEARNDGLKSCDLCV